MNMTKDFEIRSLGKSELAVYYMPDIAPRSAQKTFQRWIAKHPGLTEALAETGLTLTCRRYTPQQVRLIVEALGEP